MTISILLYYTVWYEIETFFQGSTRMYLPLPTPFRVFAFISLPFLKKLLNNRTSISVTTDTDLVEGWCAYYHLLCCDSRGPEIRYNLLTFFDKLMYVDCIMYNLCISVPKNVGKIS